MKFSYGLPHLLELPAILSPWELAVTGADQTRAAKRAEELGFDMISVPEHLIVPNEHVDYSGEFFFTPPQPRRTLPGPPSASASERASRSSRSTTRSSWRRRCRRSTG